ncbi:hypothetical protein PQO03_13245 [Lentisphaera profundi]|uniref:Uncharacterized protein n=1 Tax=Lentisphaera profundi TaxID=1658616 RepID=A0ABY7W038_9BACT|nr:hypothetical protein [Lentisphaera profundi]WDE98800.1 hypothetical protein PQO03_13245 [Lentisphaera profundi]
MYKLLYVFWNQISIKIAFGVMLGICIVTLPLYLDGAPKISNGFFIQSYICIIILVVLQIWLYRKYLRLINHGKYLEGKFDASGMKILGNVDLYVSFEYEGKSYTVNISKDDDKEEYEKGICYLVVDRKEPASKFMHLSEEKWNKWGKH